MAKEVHRLRLLECEQSTVDELAAYAQSAERKHREIRKLVMPSICEATLSKIISANFPLYGRQLLWNYGEELGVLENMTQLCSEPPLQDRGL